jgi:PGF-CTERM protein
MKRRAAIFSIAALLLITIAMTPVLAQMTIEIAPTTRVVTVPVVNVTNTTKVVTVPTVNVTKNATTSAAAGIPGFEAVFALAGLLAVAYLVMRQRR